MKIWFASILLLICSIAVSQNDNYALDSIPTEYYIKKYGSTDYGVFTRLGATGPAGDLRVEAGLSAKTLIIGCAGFAGAGIDYNSPQNQDSVTS